MNKILLLNSFGFFPSFPSVATAKVSAILKDNGLNVKSWDMNLTLWQAILEPEFLSSCEYREWVIQDTDVPFPLSVTHDTYELLKDNVITHIETALQVFKSKNDFYNHKKLSWAVDVIFQAQQLIFYHYGCFISNKVIFWPDIGFNVNDMDAIYKLSIDHERNPFIKLFHSKIIPVLEEQQPDVIGIDITFPWEILPVLTINKLIKEHFPHIHLNFTGHGFDEMSFARVAHRMDKNPQLFFEFDSIFLSRHDTEIIRFYQNIPSTVQSAEEYDSLAVRHDNVTSVSSNIIEVINESQLFPDYHDMNLTEYYTPHMVFVDKISNRCFWSKCAFCNINHFKNKSTKLDSQFFYDRLVRYGTEYNTQHFFLLDEAIKPEYISEFCDIILSNNNKFTWSIRTRIDSGFSSELLQKMFKAGCREMWIGMESASPALLKKMKKCKSPEQYIMQIENLLTECNKIGIGLHFCLLFGFPLETKEDRILTLDFFKKVKKHLKNMPFFVTFNIFNLNYGSDVHKRPKLYNVEYIDDSESNFNMINLPYKTSNGNDVSNVTFEKEIDDIAEELTSIFVPSQTNQLLWFSMGDSPWELLYKEHYAQIKQNPYQSGGGILEIMIVKAYLYFEKYPFFLKIFQRLNNRQSSSIKAQIYR
ncbi:radical SAM protein [Photobacterium sagamiensis]|uniref:B12-binding domain-containing radical SAM protein n=1 Tax=Photobacterium sagamiensis TaxID=2910241 RepID=UPI003D14A044